MKPVRKIFRRIVALIIVIALAFGALTYAGCISCSSEKLDSFMKLDDMSMEYPESWGLPGNMDGTSLMGITIPKAVGIKKSMTTAAAIADVSSLGLTPDTLEHALGDYDVTFTPTTLDGKQALRIKGSAMFVYVRAIGVVENGKLTDVAIVTCNEVEEKSSAAQFDAMIDSVRLTR